MFSFQMQVLIPAGSGPDDCLQAFGGCHEEYPADYGVLIDLDFRLCHKVL